MELNEGKIKTQLDELGIPVEKLDEVMLLVKQSIDEQDQPQEVAFSNSRESIEQSLLARMDDEKDWKKKVALAARIISMKLD